MADTMNHIERAMAALQNQPVDRLTVYPIACGVQRKLLNNGAVSHTTVGHDPNKFADRSLPVSATSTTTSHRSHGPVGHGCDLGAHVRMDEQNTPFVVDPSSWRSRTTRSSWSLKSRTPRQDHVLIEGTKQSSTPGHGGSQPVLRGTSAGPHPSRGAEYVFKDMYDYPSSRAACTRPWGTSPSSTRR
jgi:uroporphyrinogen decarboxylase